MLSIHTKIKGYGKIAAIGNIEGERYYWLTKKGVVSMIPAIFIEEIYLSLDIRRE